jgi:hypothetical protein
LDLRSRKWQEAGEECMYALPNITGVIKTRRTRWMGHVAHMGEMRNAYNILVGEPEGKRPLRRPKQRWENNIRMDIREIGWYLCGLDASGSG